MSFRLSRRLYPPAALTMALIAAVATSAAIRAAEPARAAASASPLLWGENLKLVPGSLNSDWFLSNGNVRNGLKAAHAQIIRMPARGEKPTKGGVKNLPE